MRRKRGRGRVRRLRAGLVTSHSGGPGSPSVPTTGDCLEWLDAARTKAGKSPPDRVEPKVARVRARKHGPGDRNRRDGAPRGARALRKRARLDERLVRRLALHPLGFAPGQKREAPFAAGMEYGAPRAAKNRGDDARLLVIPGRAKCEPGIQRCRHNVSLWIPGPAQTRRPGMTKGSGCLKTKSVSLFFASPHGTRRAKITPASWS